MSNDVERLRGERADLQHKLAHWQRVAEESGTMVARRVEAMREAVLRWSFYALKPRGSDMERDIFLRTGAGAMELRALPATPAPGPSAEDALRRVLDMHGATLYRDGTPICEHCQVADPCPTRQEAARGLADLTRAPGGQDVR